MLTGNPKFVASQSLPDFPYADYAESLGLRGIKVDRPEQIVPGLEEALQADRPVLLEAVTDPEVPPLPPHITFEQAVNYWRSILKGDPRKSRMIRQSLKEMVESCLPQR